MRKFVNILWRSILVALAYTIANIAVGMIFTHFGWSLSSTAPKDPSFLLFTTFISGLLMALTLGSVASLLNVARGWSVYIFTSVIFLNLVSVLIEGYFFAPGLIQVAFMPRIMLLQLLSVITCSWAISALFNKRNRPVYSKEKIIQPLFSWSWRFILSSFSYLVFYFVFGYINYQFVTKPYYDTHPGLAVPGFYTVIQVASIRAILIIASVMPLITALQVPKKKLAFITGMILFIIGGVIPLLMQVGMLPGVLLFASGVEIFFQNFLTGAVAALLLNNEKVTMARQQVRHPDTVVLEEIV